MTRLSGFTVGLLSVVCIILLLWGGIDTNNRLLTQLWDIGHVVAFFCWTVLLSRLTFCKALSFNKFMLVAVFCTIIAGTSIEVLQLIRSSAFSIGDLVKDATGTALALSIIGYFRKEAKVVLKAFIVIVSLILSLFSFKALTMTIYDEIQMYSEFPVLVDFRDTLQQQRMYALDMKIVRSVDNAALKVLQLNFNTDNYSGFALQHFVANWSNYDHISLKIYRQQNTSLTLHCRINDRQHDREGYNYQDRFNQQYILSQGWNIIDIPLQTVKESPGNRELNLAQVSHLGCFVISQPARQTIYLDTITLY